METPKNAKPRKIDLVILVLISLFAITIFIGTVDEQTSKIAMEKLNQSTTNSDEAGQKDPNVPTYVVSSEEQNNEEEDTPILCGIKCGSSLSELNSLFNSNEEEESSQKSKMNSRSIPEIKMLDSVCFEEEINAVSLVQKTVGIKISLSDITEESTTEERILAIANYAVSHGFSLETAAGVAGNIAVETRYNPSSISDSGDYYGLVQWNNLKAGGYRWREIRDWLKENGYEWDSFEGQVKAIFSGIRNGKFAYDDYSWDEFKSLKDVEQAAEMFCVYYEVCPGGSDGRTKWYDKGEHYQALNLRKSEALIAYEIMKNPNLEYYGERPYTV